MSSDMEKSDSLDDLIGTIGGFGKSQKIIVGCLSIVTLFCGICEMSYAMTAGTLRHRCLLTECETAGSPYNEPCSPDLIPNTSSGNFAACLRFNEPGSNNTQKCDSFIYETEEWTIAREDWGIHCDDDEWMLTLLGSMSNAGQCLGGFYVGFLSDRFGRQRAIISIALLASVFGLIKSFSVNFPMMATFEFIQGTLGVALFNSPFVLAMEVVKPSKRVLVGAILSITYPTGQALIAAVQWLTLDWRTTSRILYPPFLLLASFFWIMPESVRWLLNNQRIDKATSVLQKLAKINGKENINESIAKRIASLEPSKEETDRGDKKAVLLAMVKSSRMRNRFIACYFLWIVNVFIYFGMTINSVTISGNKFLNFILTNMVEIPSCIISIYVVDKIGRRLSLSGAYGICGVACIVFALIPEDDSWSWLKLLVFLIGKFGTASSYMTISLYTSELFPTPIRSSVMSWVLTGGKMAAILAPQTPLLSDIFKPLPLLVFSALSLMAAIVTITFPETLNTMLPDTMEEAESLGRKIKQ